MVDAKFLKPDTLALHAGQHPDPVTGARLPVRDTSGRDLGDSIVIGRVPVGN